MSIQINDTIVIDDSRNIANANSANFTGTGAITLPKGSSSERPSGLQGMIRYNTDKKKLEMHNGSRWIQISNINNAKLYFYTSQYKD